MNLITKLSAITTLSFATVGCAKEQVQFPTYEQIAQSHLKPVLIPGQEKCLFTMYATPSNIEEFEALIETMKSQELGKGFDPGPKPNINNKSEIELLKKTGWPMVFYPGAEMQFKNSRDAFSDEYKSLLADLDRAGVESYVQLGEWGYYFHRRSFDRSYWESEFKEEFPKYESQIPLRENWGYMKTPQSRQDCYDELKDYFQTKNKLYDSRIISVTGHSHYGPYAAEWGAKAVGLELGENISFTQSKMAFARAASRQWQIPFTIQVSPWFHASCTSWGEELRKDPDGIVRGQDAGHSESFYKRILLHSWFGGTALVTPENSLAYFFENGKAEWVDDGKGIKKPQWNLSRLGRMGQYINKFMNNHERGIPYMPLAVVIDHLAGYNGYTGKTFGYLERTSGDWQIYDLFEEQIFAGSDHATKPFNKQNPEISYLRPTPFGELVDCYLSTVDAELLSNYPVILLAGEINFDDKLIATLQAAANKGSKIMVSKEHANAIGDKIKNIIGVEVLDEWVNPQTNRTAAISNQKLGEIADKYLPFKVEDAPVGYQVNRTATGWVVEIINNEGVVKFPDKVAATDVSKVAKVAITPKVAVWSWREWSNSSDGKCAMNEPLKFEIGAGESIFVEFTE